jgi:5-methylthioadenosine/S-adenosylhomocysteine deaminase
MLQNCVALATEFDVPLHIHIAETALEQENSFNQYGMSVVPWVEKCNLFEAKVIAAHCVHVNDNEMHTLYHHRAGVAHCPSSNLKLASGTAPVQKMIDLGLHVGIGTDGPASNNDLDMFEETRLAAFLQKGVFGDPTLLPAKTAWAMATLEGARALHLDHLIGSLEPGKKADVTVISMGRTHQLPRFTRDPEGIYSQLIYATKATDVRDVIVNGRLLMRDRALLTLDEAEVLVEASRIAKRIDAFLAAREGNILSKLLAISADFIPQETFEIQVKVRLPERLDLDARLAEAGIDVTRHSIRDQYDTYFFFEEAEAGRLRFREDELKDEQGQLKNTFYTMTLMGPTSEKEFENSILLSRARYTASASHSLRFYREYFKPTSEREVIKHRRRGHILYKDTDFAINQDQLSKYEADGVYLEIKSRTWSARDALHKAALIGELLEKLQIKTEDQLKREYVNFGKQES